MKTSPYTASYAYPVETCQSRLGASDYTWDVEQEQLKPMIDLAQQDRTAICGNPLVLALYLDGTLNGRFKWLHDLVQRRNWFATSLVVRLSS